MSLSGSLQFKKKNSQIEDGSRYGYTWADKQIKILASDNQIERSRLLKK